MTSFMITVLIHGYHLQAEGWENIVWGDPAAGVWGSIPRGVEYAYRHNAAKIFWGTGASQKGGIKESQYIYNVALARVDELAGLCGCLPAELERFLKDRSYIDVITQNTIEEIKAFLDLSVREGAKEVAIVAVATHASRSIKTSLAVIVQEPAYASFRHHVVLVPADTCFAGARADDVAVVEPPHRGDMPKWQTYKYVGALFQILKQGEPVFERFLAEFGELLKKYGVNVIWPPRV